MVKARQGRAGQHHGIGALRGQPLHRDAELFRDPFGIGECLRRRCIQPSQSGQPGRKPMARDQFAVGFHIAKGDQAKAPAHHAGRQRRCFRHAKHWAGHELTRGIKRGVEADRQQYRIHLAGVFRQRFQQRMAGDDIFHARRDHRRAEARRGADDLGAWRSGGTRDGRAGFGNGFCGIRIGNQKAHRCLSVLGAA